ncbi:MAG: hypothetical protein JJ899_09390 [Alphaproteobacteria bacterium]|nr:hypothetical protein [Alphaproteobacteria bacterium]
MSERVAIDCPVVAETPADRAHFFGFHDVTPWNPAGDALVVLRCDPALRDLPDGDEAEVCVWRPGDAPAPEPVGTTTAWNFQMGARAQWLPDGRLVYNVVDKGKLGAIRVAEDGRDPERLPFAVGAIDGAGRQSLAPHYGRLARHWPAYGVPGTVSPSMDEPVPDDDGLWRLDLETGDVDLFLSVARVAAFQPLSVPPDIPHFLTHPLYSPSGARVAFLHRFLTADRATYTRLVVADRDGSSLRILAEEKVSHFCWRDDDTILVWARQMAGAIAAARRHGWLASPLLRPALRLARRMKGSMKQTLTREHYFLVPVDNPDGRRVVGREVLPVDGHPMYRPGDPNLFVTDTYPDDTRRQALMLFEMDAARRIDIGSFLSDTSVGDGDIKCDLHPRWSRNGTHVSVDTTRNGVRQSVIVDAGPALATA